MGDAVLFGVWVGVLSGLWYIVLVVLSLVEKDVGTIKMESDVFVYLVGLLELKESLVLLLRDVPRKVDCYWI